MAYVLLSANNLAKTGYAAIFLEYLRCWNFMFVGLCVIGNITILYESICCNSSLSLSLSLSLSSREQFMSVSYTGYLPVIGCSYLDAPLIQGNYSFVKFSTPYAIFNFGMDQNYTACRWHLHAISVTVNYS